MPLALCSLQNVVSLSIIILSPPVQWSCLSKLRTALLPCWGTSWDCPSWHTPEKKQHFLSYRMFRQKNHYTSLTTIPASHEKSQSLLNINLTFWKILCKLCQYHAHWCPGSLHHQIIIRCGIDYRLQAGPVFHEGLFQQPLPLHYNGMK